MAGYTDYGGNTEGPGGVAFGTLLVDNWSLGDKGSNVTPSVVGIVIAGGTLAASLVEGTTTAFFTGSRTLDTTEYYQFLFGSTQRLHAVGHQQNAINSQGVWQLETLSGGVWTAEAGTETMGLSKAESWAIAEANQSACDGVRVRGVSGSISGGPWHSQFRFYVSSE